MGAFPHHLLVHGIGIQTSKHEKRICIGIEIDGVMKSKRPRTYILEAGAVQPRKYCSVIGCQ